MYSFQVWPLETSHVQSFMLFSLPVVWFRHTHWFLGSHCLKMAEPRNERSLCSWVSPWRREVQQPRTPFLGWIWTRSQLLHSAVRTEGLSSRAVSVCLLLHKSGETARFTLRLQAAGSRLAWHFSLFLLPLGTGLLCSPTRRKASFSQHISLIVPGS